MADATRSDMFSRNSNGRSLTVSRSHDFRVAKRVPHRATVPEFCGSRPPGEDEPYSATSRTTNTTTAVTRLAERGFVLPAVGSPDYAGLTALAAMPQCAALPGAVDWLSVPSCGLSTPSAGYARLRRVRLRRRAARPSRLQRSPTGKSSRCRSLHRKANGVRREDALEGRGGDRGYPSEKGAILGRASLGDSPHRAVQNGGAQVRSFATRLACREDHPSARCEGRRCLRAGRHSRRGPPSPTRR